MQSKHATIASLLSLALAPSFLARAQTETDSGPVLEPRSGAVPAPNPEPVPGPAQPVPAPFLSCYSVYPMPLPQVRVSVFHSSPRPTPGPVQPTPDDGRVGRGVNVEVLEEIFGNSIPDGTSAHPGDSVTAKWQHATLTGSGTQFRIDYVDGITSIWGDWTTVIDVPSDDPSAPTSSRYGRAVLNRIPQSSVVELLCVAP